MFRKHSVWISTNAFLGNPQIRFSGFHDTDDAYDADFEIGAGGISQTASLASSASFSLFSEKFVSRQEIAKRHTNVLFLPFLVFLTLMTIMTMIMIYSRAISQKHRHHRHQRHFLNILYAITHPKEVHKQRINILFRSLNLIVTTVTMVTLFPTYPTVAKNIVTLQQASRLQKRPACFLFVEKTPQNRWQLWRLLHRQQPENMLCF